MGVTNKKNTHLRSLGNTSALQKYYSLRYVDNKNTRKKSEVVYRGEAVRQCVYVWVREKREDVISGIDIFISLRFNSSQTHTPYKLNNRYRYPDTERERGEEGRDQL